MKKSLLYTSIVFLLCLIFVATQAQKTITINLKVNEEQEATVFQNEPVLFDIAVSNKRAEVNERWNKAADRRLDEMKELLKQGQIKQEDYDKEKTLIEKNKRSIDVTTLGSETSSWASGISWKIMNTANRNVVVLPIKLMKRPDPGGKAVLDADGYYMASFGIGPEELKSVAPGTYAIEVSVNNLLSNAVVLKVENGMMSETMANSEAMLLRLGIYYWHAEDAARTIQYADKILAKKPTSLDGLSLKGDGQVLQQSYLPALETYNKAVKEYYKQNGAGSEPPEYLLSMIGMVKEKLGDVRN